MNREDPMTLALISLQAMQLDTAKMIETIKENTKVEVRGETHYPAWVVNLFKDLGYGYAIT